MEEDIPDWCGCGICPGCDQCPVNGCPRRTTWPDLSRYRSDWIQDQGCVVLRNTMDCPWISLIRIDGVLQWDYEGVFYD